jgi:hypothetical protein
MLEKMDIEAVSVSKSNKFAVATSEVWQYLINDHWVIGTTFTNAYTRYNKSYTHL